MVRIGGSGFNAWDDAVRGADAVDAVDADCLGSGDAALVGGNALHASAGVADAPSVDEAAPFMTYVDVAQAFMAIAATDDPVESTTVRQFRALRRWAMEGRISPEDAEHWSSRLLDKGRQKNATSVSDALNGYLSNEIGTGNVQIAEPKAVAFLTQQAGFRALGLREKAVFTTIATLADGGWAAVEPQLRAQLAEVQHAGGDQEAQAQVFRAMMGKSYAADVAFKLRSLHPDMHTVTGMSSMEKVREVSIEHVGVTVATGLSYPSQEGELYHLRADGKTIDVFVGGLEWRNAANVEVTVDLIKQKLERIPASAIQRLNGILLLSPGPTQANAQVNWLTGTIEASSYIDDLTFVHEVGHLVAYGEFGIVGGMKYADGVEANGGGGYRIGDVAGIDVDRAANTLGAIAAATSGSDGWKRWDDAVKADGLGVSDYGNINLHEDFAEAYAFYLMTRNMRDGPHLKFLMPNRWRLLEQIVGD